MLSIRFPYMHTHTHIHIHIGRSGCSSRPKGVPAPREVHADLSRVTFGKPSGGGGKLWLCAPRRPRTLAMPALLYPFPISLNYCISLPFVPSLSMAR